jgi:hypothetical protein
MIFALGAALKPYSSSSNILARAIPKQVVLFQGDCFRELLCCFSTRGSNYNPKGNERTQAKKDDDPNKAFRQGKGTRLTIKKINPPTKDKQG